MVKLVVLLCAITALTQAVRIKIYLSRDSVERYHALISKRQTQDTACSDAVVVDRGSLTLPGRLNQLNGRVRFYRSEIARDNLNIFQDMARVPLASGTVLLREVLNTLRNNLCFPFFYGGAVRDQFLGAQPNDADVEIDCSIETFFNVCTSTWGEVNCGRSSSRPLGHVGIVHSDLENVDVASTSITFYAPLSDLEYTANSLALDLNGLDVVIDLPGTGEMDVCNRCIRIPSDDDSLSSWDAWAVDTNKLLRFWKLRIKNFRACNASTLHFITNQVMARLQTEPNKFGTFYCYNVYDGSRYTAANRQCNASATVCEDGREKAEKYNNAFAEDFGDYWTNVLEPDLLPTCAGGLALCYSFNVIFTLWVFAYFLVA